MVDHVVLRYKRDGGDTSTGTVLLFEDKREVIAARFTRLPFAKMMTHFAELLQKHPDAAASIERNDRPGLNPFLLDEATVHLLRTDPVAAIRSMTYVPPPPTRVGQKSSSGGLEAGYPVLVEAFGERVYCRVRVPGRNGDSADLECPGCGGWSALHTPFVCKRCGLLQYVEVLYNNRWAGMSVENLLGTSFERFFLPRAWNKGNNWVSREDLELCYEQFKKEREEACSHPKK